MRPFKLMTAFLFACTTAMAACGGSGDDDPSVDGGITPNDCTAGEVGCAPTGVPTTSGGCTDPDYPVDCAGDGLCWPVGTDCNLEMMHCGTVGSSNEVLFRCETSTQKYSCCDYQPVLCPADKPFPCPATGTCTETEVCDISSCLDMVGIGRSCH